MSYSLLLHLEKVKLDLSGRNFIDWFCNVRTVLRSINMEDLPRRHDSRGRRGQKLDHNAGLLRQQGRRAKLRDTRQKRGIERRQASVRTRIAAVLRTQKFDRLRIL